MLHAAGTLTIELQLRAFDSGMTLKDATPSNILFNGSSPVFVDYLSFETRQAGQVLWLAYAQFVRTFVLPLLAYRLCGILPHEHFLAYRDGVEPEELYRKISFFQRLSPQALRFITLPALLGKSSSAKAPANVAATGGTNVEKNDFVARALLQGLADSFRKLAPRQTASRWSDYMSCHNYEREAFVAKEAFVKAALLECSPKTVLDVGCNTGHFSNLAAELGATVVALDYDTAALDRVCQLSNAGTGKILPLVVNLARPTPALGWANAEQSAFLDRSKQRFDFVLLLAVIHHLSVTDGIPLREIFRVVAETTKVAAVVEYVAPTDSMMQGLLRNKEHLIPSLTRQCFEDALSPWFSIVRQETRSDEKRTLYLLKRKDS